MKTVCEKSCIVYNNGHWDYSSCFIVRINKHACCQEIMSECLGRTTRDSKTNSNVWSFSQILGNMSGREVLQQFFILAN